MSATTQADMGLDESDLNDTDRLILDVLSEGRATPQLVRKRLAESGVEVSRQYVNQRLKRFSEHDHVDNVLATGVYELTTDPRD